MATLNELLAQRTQLEAQIAQMQSTARADAIAQIKALMADHGLTAADLTEGGGRKAEKTKKSSTVAAKYKNQATGDSWSGRGLQPRWLKAAIAGGVKLDDFKV